MKKNISINVILNTTKTLLSIIFPLITTPYILSVLGATNVGKVTYVSSIISYFIIFASFGVSSYAIREGSRIKENNEKINKFFSEVVFINIITTILSFLLLYVCTITIAKFESYRVLILIISFNIIFTTFSLDWINVIYEDYLYITIRSILANIISLIFLFIFVKNRNDYYIYAGLLVLVNMLICISNWLYVKKKVKFELVKLGNISKHLKSLVVLFINSLMVSIYVNIDNVLLGWICGDYYVGLYTLPVKLYTTCKTLCIAIFSVYVSRLSIQFKEKDEEGFKKLFTNVLSIITILFIPICTGMIVLSKEFVVLFGGVEYIETNVTLSILAISLIFAALGGTVTSCLNVSTNREDNNLKASVISVVINTFGNIMLIPYLKQNAAALTTMISEFIVLAYCLMKTKNKSKVINIKSMNITFFKTILSSLIMAIIIVLLKYIVKDYLLLVVLGILIGAIIYFVSLYAMKEENIMTFFEKTIKIIKTKVSKM